MKQIFLVRHAKSSWDHPGLSDLQRPLNARGIKDAPAMGRIFTGLVESPIILISSPAIRAFSTASMFREQLGPETPHELESSLYHGDENDYLACLQEQDERYKSVALFGHNPIIENFCAQITNSWSGAIPTCAILQFQSRVSKWQKVKWNNILYLNHYFPKEV